MEKLCLYKDYHSGVDFDYDYSSSSGFNRNRMPSIEPMPSIQSTTSIAGMIRQRRSNALPLIRFPSDGIVERIRPITMKNSENGDFIICETARGTYIAYRTPIVPPWVKRLVHEIESQQ